MNQIINMALRMIMRRGVNAGINRGLGFLSRMGKRQEPAGRDTDETTGPDNRNGS